MIELTVSSQDDRLPVEEFLQRQIPAAPASYLRQLLKKGKVKSAGRSIAPGESVRSGDLLQLPETGRLQELLATPPQAASEVSILYESREILVVDKPAGVAIHSSQGHERDNLTARAAALLAERGLRFKVAPVHRLDLETSGPVLFGKGRQACAALGKLFMQHEVEKFYQALVLGRTAGSGRLTSILSAKGKEKAALSEYHALARNEQASLLELQLHTGRQHQIRRQLAESGHPLFGDKRYRGPCPAELPRLFLHCSHLAFVDPFSNTPIAVASRLPPDLSGFLPQVGIDFR